jgi:formylglycine-generating enzyme required for sulfatase activity
VWISRTLLVLGMLAMSAVMVDHLPAGEAIDGNPLIQIPAGSFVFGNNSGNKNERPQQVITGKPFAINRTEITNAQYRHFVDQTGHRLPFYNIHPLLALDDHPVVGVSWNDATSFCAYYGLRLPSEREYERAARGTDGAMFPWGSAPVDPVRVNGGALTCCGPDGRDGYEMTASSNSFPLGASKEGVLHLVGNVWEWTRDSYAPYTAASDEKTAGNFRVLRGGAWNSDPLHLSTTYRLAYAPDFRFAANGGFRCVSSGD